MKKIKLLLVAALSLSLMSGAFAQFTASVPKDVQLGTGSGTLDRNKVEDVRTSLEQMVVLTDGDAANATFADGVSNGTTTYTSATAAFVAGDVGKNITGTDIPSGTTIASRTNGTTIVLSAAATGSHSGNSFVIVGRQGNTVTVDTTKGTSFGVVIGGNRVISLTTPLANTSANATFADGVSNGTTTYTSATATFVAGDVGLNITGTNIPSGTTIASRTNGTTIVLSQAATASGSSLPFVIVGRTASNASLTPGSVIYLAVAQDATGSRIPTWASTIHWPGGTAPTLTTTAGRMDLFRFHDLGNGTWMGSTIGLNYIP